MEIVNAATPGMKPKPGKHSKKYIYFGDGRVTISTAACEEYGISSGISINFVFDLDRLYFYIDNNPDGFKLIKREATFRFYSTGLIDKVNEKYFSLTKRDSLKFGLRLLPTKINGCSLIEILIRSKL